MSDPALKGWYAWNDGWEDGPATYVVAPTRNAARTWVHADEWVWTRAKRVPALDGLPLGEVTARDLLTRKAVAWVGCAGCDRPMYDEGVGPFRYATEDELEESDDEVVAGRYSPGGAVQCETCWTAKREGER